MTTEANASVTEVSAQGSAPVVLVAEDEIIVRMDVANALRERGFRVLEAYNADEAIELVSATPDLDVVFSDIHMPGSMNGTELAVWLRSHRPDVPVLLTSGVFNYWLSSSEHSGKLPHVFQKPYDMDLLVDVLNALAERRRAAMKGHI
jgi:DNA-binding NtrC family response regulator